MITVNKLVNNGKPSVKVDNGYVTVKQVVNFYNAFLQERSGSTAVLETITELGVLDADVYDCLEYAKLYPVIML